MDRLKSMKIFVRVATHGSFIAAAEELEISPQMVSKHVAALEHQLDARLISRTTRKQSLTPLGYEYLQRCQLILEQIDEADALAQRANDVPRGHLRINAPVTFGREVLTPFMTHYLQRYPGVDLSLELSDRLVDPVEEGFEAVIRIGVLDTNLALVAKPLKPYRLIACASPAYLQQHGLPSTPADLQAHECLGFTPWPTTLRQEWRFQHDDQSYNVSVSGRFNTNDWGAIHRAALEGSGIALGYEAAVSRDLASGSLVQILADYTGPSRPMHLLYADSRRMTPKLRLFIDEIVSAFGQDSVISPAP